MPRIDEIFEFIGLNQRPARCRIRLYARLPSWAIRRPIHDDEPVDMAQVVVVATELEDNPGASITNAAEECAAQVCQRFGIHPSRLIWVEHYDDRLQVIGQRVHERIGRKNGESFDLVTFDFRDARSVNDIRGASLGEPHWRFSDKAAVEALIGEKLP